jgi:hypothetical protein
VSVKNPNLQLVASHELRKQNEQLVADLELEKRKAAYGYQWRDEELARLRLELESAAKRTGERTSFRQGDTFGEKTQVVMLEAARAAGEQAARDAFVQKRKDDALEFVDAIRGGRRHVILAVAVVIAVFLVTMIGWGLLSQVNIHVTPKGHVEAP